MFLFLPLSLQNDTNMLFVFHYDQNLTGCGQYVQLSLGQLAANIQAAAKPEKTKRSQKLVDQETTMNRINKPVDSTTAFTLKYLNQSALNRSER